MLSCKHVVVSMCVFLPPAIAVAVGYVFFDGLMYTKHGAIHLASFLAGLALVGFLEPTLPVRFLRQSTADAACNAH